MGPSNVFTWLLLSPSCWTCFNFSPSKGPVPTHVRGTYLNPDTRWHVPLWAVKTVVAHNRTWCRSSAQHKWWSAKHHPPAEVSCSNLCGGLVFGFQSKKERKQETGVKSSKPKSPTAPPVSSHHPKIRMACLLSTHEVVHAFMDLVSSMVTFHGVGWSYPWKVVGYNIWEGLAMLQFLLWLARTLGDPLKT